MDSNGHWRQNDLYNLTLKLLCSKLRNKILVIKTWETLFHTTHSSRNKEENHPLFYRRPSLRNIPIISSKYPPHMVLEFSHKIIPLFRSYTFQPFPFSIRGLSLYMQISSHFPSKVLLNNIIFFTPNPTLGYKNKNKALLFIPLI